MGSFIYIPTSGSNAPVITGTPTIIGSGIVGQTLTGSIAPLTIVGSPTPTITFQWFRNGVAISGASGTITSPTTTTTYLIQAADAGTNISIQIIATNTNGTAFVDSANTSIFLTIADVYPTNAAFGWALFLLRGAYFNSPIVRIRRTNDNAERDFFVGDDGRLKVNGLTNDFISFWCGPSEGFVTVLYDQIGTSNFTQTTNTTQYRIWTGTAVETIGTPANICMSARVQSSPSTSTGGIMSVVGSAAAGTFNFLHDGSTPFSIFSVTTGVALTNVSNNIASTMAGNTIGFRWNFNSNGATTNVSLSAYNATPALTLSAPLNSQAWLTAKALYLNWLVTDYTLNPSTQRVRGYIGKYNHPLNNQGGVAGGVTPSSDLTIGGTGGLNVNPHQFVALLVYKTEANAYQIRNALATLTNLT